MSVSVTSKQPPTLQASGPTHSQVGFDPHSAGMGTQRASAQT